MEESSFFQRLKKGLTKVRGGWVQRLNDIFQTPGWDEETLETMEEILLSADVGVKATQRLLDTVRQQFPKREQDTGQSPAFNLQQEIISLLEGPGKRRSASAPAQIPWVVIFLGVNGVGKTTTIGKVAAGYRQAGKEVLLVAGDTFRAAASEQLEIWGQRVGAEVVKHRPGADPAAVVFDGIHAAQRRKADIVLIDTAGRLHTKVQLLEELKKVQRVIAREQVGAPHETLLVLDATTGQNALQQARVFNESLNVTGIVLTKLDGTAKGGVIIGIREELGIPVQYIGVGEAIDDLHPFDPARFVHALFDPA
ncbi:MAG: signal recognition particle-docking protein FtsY [Candidatus Binatia bacterium]